MRHPGIDDDIASRCPLCGERNACAMASPIDGGPPSPCWCTTASFSDTLLAALAPAARGVACICARCASAPRRPQDEGNEVSHR